MTTKPKHSKSDIKRRQIMGAHTPTPEKKCWPDFVHLDSGKMLPVVEGFKTLEEAQEYCNSHEELLEACKDALNMLCDLADEVNQDNYGLLDRFREAKNTVEEAITKAEQI